MKLLRITMAHNSEYEDNSAREETAHNSESKRLLNRVSKERIEFCKSVATRAKKIANDLIQKPTWRQGCNQFHLHREVVHLVDQPPLQSIPLALGLVIHQFHFNSRCPIQNNEYETGIPQL